MLKRNIAVLIAGVLLGAQVNLAAADQGALPKNDIEIYSAMLPAQAKYFAEREAGLQTAVRGDSFPGSADDQIWAMLPAQ